MRSSSGQHRPDYVITQAIEIAFQRDADFEKTLPARAAGPVVSALRATAQPPCPPTCRAPSVQAGRGPPRWRLPVLRLYSLPPSRHFRRTVLLRTSLGSASIGRQRWRWSATRPRASIAATRSRMRPCCAMPRPAWPRSVRHSARRTAKVRGVSASEADRPPRVSSSGGATRLVAWDGVEPPTRGFSVQPSTEDHSESKIAKESDQGLAQADDAGKNDV